MPFVWRQVTLATEKSFGALSNICGGAMNFVA
jgi:hypothetical protein